MKKGDYPNAIKYYRKGLVALKKYPDDNNPEKVAKDAENVVAYIKAMEEKLGK
jgi:hypothetical protein